VVYHDNIKTNIEFTLDGYSLVKVGWNSIDTLIGLGRAVSDLSKNRLVIINKQEISIIV
jgi:hypothetical protein